jgi:hypothetical protein
MNNPEGVGRPSQMAWCPDCWFWDEPRMGCTVCLGTGFDPIPWTELFMVGVGYGGYKP